MRQIWTALSAISALIAVTVAFDGYIAGPVLLAMAVMVAIAGRHDDIARWAAIGFAVVGGGIYLSYAPPGSLVNAGHRTGHSCSGVDAGREPVLRAGMRDHDRVVVERRGRYLGGFGRGDRLRRHRVHGDRRRSGRRNGRWLLRRSHGRDDLLDRHGSRTVHLRGAADPDAAVAADRRGLALAAAAMAKLFLFDLGTLDGIFRVVVFIVVGLVLLGMGAGYPRLLERQDQQQDHAGVTGATG